MERRVYTVTGQQPAQEDVERLIETGESETIFQKAILEQGRGQVPPPPSSGTRTATMSCCRLIGSDRNRLIGNRWRIRWRRSRSATSR